ncbi:DotI/IcmL/TraM family protein [Pseudovibrio ascidiaceicola]|uniref:DotI/IcmL/TraM family protein n=1 Tax=Pseudovibrio ascidiaceicola TaxID=285279 RepID=UPI003D35C4A0
MQVSKLTTYTKKVAVTCCAAILMTSISYIAPASSAKAKLVQSDISEDKVKKWTVDRVTQLYSMTFFDYKNKIDDFALIMTPSGARSFRNALEASGTIDMIRYYDFVLESKVGELVDITKTNGSKYEITMPLDVTYLGPNYAITFQYIMDISVIGSSDGEHRINNLNFQLRSN